MHQAVVRRKLHPSCVMAVVAWCAMTEIKRVTRTRGGLGIVVPIARQSTPTNHLVVDH